MLLEDIIFGLSNSIATDRFNQNIFDQISVERLIRDIGKEEAIRLLKKVVENNQKILELQKQLAAAMLRGREKSKIGNM